MSDLSIIVTNAGRAALVNAQNNGTNPVLIASVGVSTTAFPASAATTAIAGELKRVATIAGEVVADDTMHLVVRDESADTYTLRSFGLYLGDGTLFAVYSQAGPIIEKSAQSMLLLALDVRFADINAADLTFGDANFLNPPATTDQQGVVELATEAEAETGTDATRAVTPKALKSAVTSWLNTRLGAGAPSAFVKTLLTAASAVALRAAIGLGSAATRNEGAGGGLDADLLDGQHSAYYTNIPARLGYTPWGPTNDGAGSGLDADTVDGRQASEFALLTGAAFTGPISATTGSFTGPLEIGGNLSLPAGSRISFGSEQVLWKSADNATVALSGGTSDLRLQNAARTANNLLITDAGAATLRGALTVGGQINAGGHVDIPDGSALTYAGSAMMRRAGNELWLYGGANGYTLRNGTNTTTIVSIDNAGAITNSGALNTGGSIFIPNNYAFYIGGKAVMLANSNTTYIRGQGTGGIVFQDSTGSFTRMSLSDTGVLSVAGGITRAGNTVWDAGNDGSGSGLDADLLDGQQGSYYLPAGSYTAADVLNKLKTVDGTGSALDADLLDGLHATAFAKIADFAATGHSPNGYQILPNGLILQWGRVSVSEDAYGTLAFPIAFTSACWSLLMGVATEVGNTTAQANGPMPYAVSITGASLYNAAPTASAWWIAIGK